MAEVEVYCAQAFCHLSSLGMKPELLFVIISLMLYECNYSPLLLMSSMAL